MKNILFLIVLLTIGGISQGCTTGQAAYPGEWENLGSRKVNFGIDRDEITVTRREGTFSKIRLKVTRGSVNMHECIVVFGDGSRQRVALKNTFYPGSGSRVIDVKGGRRVIRKVILIYDTKNYANKKAKVTLLGMH